MKPIDDNHITIQGWMRTALNLKGERLQAFALIYGFSQDGESKFYGSIKYIMDWLGCSKPTAIAVLDYLTNLHLITKHAGKTGIESNRYTVNAVIVDALREERARVVKELNRGGKESLPAGVKNFNHRGKDSLPDNTNDNINENIGIAPAQFHVQVHSLETIHPEDNTAGAAFDWMQVARQMEAYAKGDGAAQWRFMCEAQSYKGEVLPIVSNWASKASKYQLMNWKSEFRKLQTWLKTESRADYKAAQRPAYGQQTAAPVVAPAMRLTNPKDAPR